MKKSNAISRAPSTEVKAEAEADDGFDQAKVDALDARWQKEVLEVLKAGKTPKSIFPLAELILKENPALLNSLADDLYGVIRVRPSAGKIIRTQWEKGGFASKKIFMNEDGSETLGSMVFRIKDEGQEKSRN